MLLHSIYVKNPGPASNPQGKLGFDLPPEGGMILNLRLDGRDVLRAGLAEQLLLADIDSNAIAAAKETNLVLKDLRPQFYLNPVKIV
jgi:hypothetical protein